MIERSFDYRKIKKIISYSPVISSEFIYLIDDDIGVFSYEKYKDGYLVHANVLKKGKAAVESAKKSFEWIFNNTTTDIIYAVIKRNNRATCHFAVQAGMNRTHDDEQFNYFNIKKCLN